MRRPRRLFWLLFLPLFAAVSVSVSLAGWYAAAHLRRFTVDTEATDLEAAAHLALFRLADMLPGDPETLRQVCREMAARSERRVTLVLPGNQVACDSEVSRTSFNRPGELTELTTAFAGGVGQAIRTSRTLGRSYLYVAVPLRRGDAVAAVLRLGLPFASVEERLRAIRLQLLTAAAGIILAGAAASYSFARWLARPIEKLRRTVDSFAAGDLHAPLPRPHTVEVAALGTALQAMADQLDARIGALDEQRGMQEAILTGMAEGVLAIDVAGRLLLSNRAATAMLGMRPGALPGTPLRETPGAAPVLDLLARAVESAEPLEAEIAAGAGGALPLLARCAPLRNRDGARIGALVVLNDVSRVQRLERVRRDFVTNVSHELKTPITTIAGYLELLLGGGLDDRQTAERFLRTAASQVERMRAVIDDLLVLARLEPPTGEAGSSLQAVNLCDILAAAAEAVREDAEHTGVSLELRCPEGLPASADPLLLPRAVANLLRNAISHTPSGRRVSLEGRLDPEGIAIAVRDWGSGIAAEHLPSIFEPFYRVDRGRSRRLGGSGLGLALVRQIAVAHGGGVSVESAPGQGSCFTIRLPAAAGAHGNDDGGKRA